MRTFIALEKTFQRCCLKDFGLGCSNIDIIASFIFWHLHKTLGASRFVEGQIHLKQVGSLNRYVEKCSGPVKEGPIPQQMKEAQFNTPNNSKCWFHVDWGNGYL